MPNAAINKAIGIDKAIAHFTARNPGPIDSVTLLPRDGLYAIRSFDRRDVDDIGRLWTYLDMKDGRVIAQRHDRGDSAGDAVSAWLYPLHSGRAFNLSGKSVIAMAGLATALLVATGIVLW